MKKTKHMRNYNWRTKLKKNFYKKNKNEIRLKMMRTKIEYQTTKRTMMYFSCQEREKKEKQKQITTDDNPINTRLHVPLHVEEETVVHPMRRQMIKLGHRVTSHMPPEWRERSKLTGSFGRCANRSLNKQLKKNVKIPKHPLWTR
jgi:hypothetical protein